MAFPLLSVLPLIGQALDKIFPDPTERSKAQVALIEAEQKGELAELDASMKAIVAEAQSEHWLAANWRPVTMLTFVAIIANNYIIYPYLSLFWMEAPVLTIPPDMWGLLKIGLGGYVIGRSAEKGIRAWKG